MRSLRFLTALLSALLPATACAEKVIIRTGVTSTVAQVLAGLVNVQLAGAGIIATGLFLIGAMIMIGSTGNDQFVTAGKRLMKASVIGLVIVLSSWMILSTLVYFIYA